MADKTISALTGASTPLAGTEVLPIVQGGSTVKVSIANVTAGRAMSALSGSFGTGTPAYSIGGTQVGITNTSANTYLSIYGGVGSTNGGFLLGGNNAENFANLFWSSGSNFMQIATTPVGSKVQFNIAGVVVGDITSAGFAFAAGKGVTTSSATALGLGTNGSVSAVTIDTSGNLGVGAAPNATSGRNITISSIESSIALVSTGSKSYSIASGGNYQYTNNALCFIDNTAAAARMLLTTDGELWVANLGDQGAYNLQVGGTGVWGAGAYVNGSDSRLKEEVAPIAPCLDIVNALNPVTFRYKEDYSKDQSTQPGFIAQELLTALEGQNYIGGVVHEGPEHYNVAYQSLIPVLVKAVQELSARVADLEAR
jgi:hypothetical protein